MAAPQPSRYRAYSCGVRAAEKPEVSRNPRRQNCGDSNARSLDMDPGVKREEAAQPLHFSWTEAKHVCLH